MIKIFYPEILEEHSIIHPNREEAHHLFYVLRARDGEKIMVLNGQGYSAEGHVLDHKTQEIYIDHVYFTPKGRITLCPALLKNKAMDFLIREATAMGVAEIMPLMAERSEVKIDTIMTVEKQIHWRNIAKEACKQSGNPNIPSIEILQKIEQMDFQKPTLIAALQGSVTNISFHQETIRHNAINLVIGPEGDFSDQEYQFFSEKGAHFIHLGKYILRSETAALYLLGVVDHLMGDHY